MSKTAAALFLFICTVIGSMAIAGPAELRRVSFTSYGAARIGMTRHALEEALGEKLKSENPDADSESCEYVAPSGGYEGLSFMLINQRLARIDVTSPRVMTLAGARVGASQRAVMALYPGRVEVSPHAYTAPDGSYLTVYSSDRRHGIRFETDHGKITVFYAGTAEAIQYIEGCQ